MRYLLFWLLVVLTACEAESFDSDKRQIVAKDQIRRQLKKARSFDVTGFREDTLPTYTDTTVKNPIQYSIDFTYTDSAGHPQQKKGIVVFTPDGKSVLNSRILD